MEEPEDYDGDDAGPVYTGSSNINITITPNSDTFAGGKIRVAAIYYTLIPPIK